MIIGFQELSLSADALMFNATKQAICWKQHCLDLAAQTSSDDKHLLIDESLLVGLYLLVFVRTSLANTLDLVKTAYVGSGLLGKLGNKGGVGVSCCIGTSSFCFINVHLAAHVEYLKRRNADAKNVIDNLFRIDGGNRAVSQHDVVVFFGDLNYRLTLPIEQTVALIKSQGD